ncbi:NifU family protein [Streptomyces sp. MUM 178J]|uniref:NifU family protein n=1 Tax=Streptomyces sp. MUM 178J TaxID=2791991 RepID=UPI001F04348E|nr:NifU family protein [Streptomyces sp. MUM 178J]WRQ80115.1 NifU family protein [Streptomyces sp. MUM 178J]
MPWDEEAARRHVVRTEQQLAALDSLPDHAAAARAREAVQALVDLYGECLARITAQLGEADGQAVRRLAGDPLVGHLLLVHDLHPDPVTSRIGAVLAELRPALGGGEAELLAVEGPVARLRLTEGGASGGCGCSPDGRPDDMVRDAVLGRAPEIEQVEIETVRAAAPQAVIPVADLFRGPALAVREAG